MPAICVSLRIALQRANPSMRGIRTSLTMASGLRSRARSSAASPSSARMTSNPALVRASCPSLRCAGSSSARSTVLPALRGDARRAPQVPLDDLDEARRFDGLHQHVEEARREHAGLDGRRPAGDGDDGQARGEGAQTARDLEAIHVGQACSPRGRSKESAPTRDGARSRRPRLLRPSTLRLEREPHHLPGRGVVLDDQDRARRSRRHPLRCEVLGDHGRQGSRCRSAWRRSHRIRRRAPSPHRPSSRRR